MTCGLSIYLDENRIPYVLAFVNTPIILWILQLINPTLNCQCGDVARVPIIYDEKNKEIVSKYSKENIGLSREDWDRF